IAEAAARRADAERTVEREQCGLRAHRRRAAVRALPALATGLDRTRAENEPQSPLAAAERELRRFDEPRRLVRAPGEPIDDDFDFLRARRQPRQRLERRDRFADPDPRESGLEEMRGLLVPRDPLEACDRREDQQRLAFGPRG